MIESDKPYDRLEVFHGKILEVFHDYRKAQGSATDININGSELSEIIAEAKNRMRQENKDHNNKCMKCGKTFHAWTHFTGACCEDCSA